MSIASTAELAQAAQLCPETVLRMRRDPNGPFKQHRDWQFVGLGTRKIRWNKDKALESLWSHKRVNGYPGHYVETLSIHTNNLPLFFPTVW